MVRSEEKWAGLQRGNCLAAFKERTVMCSILYRQLKYRSPSVRLVSGYTVFAAMRDSKTEIPAYG